MGIFDRLSTLIRSNINDLISRAENPEKMLNQLTVDMRTQLAKAKQQVAAAIADEKRLAAQVDQEKKAAEDWEKRAVLAVQEGRDDLAKQALLRHNEHAQGALQLHDTWIKHREETDKLKVSLPAQRPHRGSQAQEEHPDRPPEACRGAQAHPGDHVLDRRQERVRDVREDGGADRARGAEADRGGRSERRLVGRHAGQAVSVARGEGRRGPAAARLEAQDGAPAGGLPGRGEAPREGGGRSGAGRG